MVQEDCISIISLSNSIIGAKMKREFSKIRSFFLLAFALHTLVVFTWRDAISFGILDGLWPYFPWVSRIYRSPFLVF